MSAIPAPSVYQNPYMADNNYSEIHLNSYQTDTFSVPGPASFAHSTVQQKLIRPLGGIAGSITVDTKTNQLVTIRVAPGHVRGEGFVSTHTLMLLDPSTLNVLASQPLPNTKSMGVTFSGGGYFYLNNDNQVVLVTTQGVIQIYSIGQGDNGQWEFTAGPQYNVKAALKGDGDLLNSVLPDSTESGNLWFISKDGAVGYVNPTTGDLFYTSVSPGETISKSFATDGQGRVFVVSDNALYCFQAKPSGGIQEVWRTPYDYGTRRRPKPGQIQIGSGTTPTCFDDFAGNQFVTIADNADKFMHVNVYNRATGALVAQQEVFTNLPFRSDTENSLIAVNDSIIVENNYGNRTPASTLGRLTTKPDIDRVDFNPSTGQSQVTWQNSHIAVPSVVSQLSTADGFLYTYAKDRRGWYWAALSYQTGDIVAKARVPWSKVALGAPANNYYGGLTVGPDGTAYEGVFGGIVAWRPQLS
jgi:hypothetical protein